MRNQRVWNTPRAFTLVELLIIIMILGILMAMVVPNVAVVREHARVGAMKMNLHSVQIVIEQFHAEQGYYADDFYEDEYGAYFPGGVWEEEIGRLPTNPWSGRQMDPDEFNPEDADEEPDLYNTEEFGPNDHSGFWAGEIIYTVYDPPGTFSPTHYNLLGIQHGGVTIRGFDAENEVVIFVLHN
ncbi:MAG: prepilin-type N-terminal cleavage/methylation domain-containing protein [candidate division WOR-3 bacterium]|nr:MAG: prepilin-type N-terminal cleavage/methylation domain-containing protein [candidate division WOR-3 bacterium]